MRLYKFAALMLLAGLLQSCGKPPEWHYTDISGSMPDLDFSLQSPGGLLDAADLHGKPVLVFFGFTNCPHVCPMTLTAIAAVRKDLGALANEVQVLLVTVDPKRDTPEVLQAFAASFGPWLTGLTGSEEDLAALRQAYGVYAAMESSEAMGNYNVMHTTALFAFDARGHARLLITDVTDTKAIAADMRRLIRG
jgi:protein SCO1/2